MNRRLGGPQRLSGRLGDKKNKFLSLSRFEPRIIQPVSLGSIPTMLAKLQCYHITRHINTSVYVFGGVVVTRRFWAVYNARAPCVSWQSFKYSQFKTYRRSVCHLKDFAVWMPQACSGREVAHWARNFSESWCKWNLYVDTVPFLKETFHLICAAWHSTHTVNRSKHQQWKLPWETDSSEVTVEVHSWRPY